MKKLFLIIAAVCAVTVLDAQNRDALLSKISKAKEASQNEKKNTKASTWFALGQAYLEGYQAVKGDALVGASQDEMKLIMAGQKVESTEEVTLAGVNYIVEHYADKDLYYSGGRLECINVIKPIMNEDVLALAFEAYLKGVSLDAKSAKNKDVINALIKIHDGYTADAWTAYVLNDFDKSSSLFEKALPVFDNEIVGKKDTTSTYYAAAISNAAGKTDKAKELYKKCFEMGYDQEGNGHAAMAEILKSEGDLDGAKAVLNEGFQAFPSSQSILISLINLYIETKDDTSKILDLIHTAQANEPKNASLFYAEANVYKQLGDKEKAIELFNKSLEVNPDYVYGIYEVGNMYYNDAIEIQTAMDALDVNDVKGYNELRDKFDATLKQCIPPFEKAFEVAKADEIKKAIAQQLKQVFFIFRNESDEYKSSYEKYQTYLGE
ncbi:MAG: tetratricopeptide repeat protein [Alistipes sp.]|nr:tetratricopeptide repeat protein [Candidatus Minthomonas equi]